MDAERGEHVMTTLPHNFKFKTLNFKLKNIVDYVLKSLEKGETGPGSDARAGP